MNVNRVRHLENALRHFERPASDSGIVRSSIDSHLRAYFRAHKAKLTGEDKGWLMDQFKDLYRWRGLVNHFGTDPSDVAETLRTYLGNSSWRSYADSKTLPGHTRGSMPESLYERLVLHFGKEKTLAISKVWNERSPCFLRINPLVDDRDRILKFLASKGHKAEPTKTSPLGIRLPQSGSLASAPELAEHVVDLQDESCQIAGQQVHVQPGEKVLDYCCGSGGKSLVFAPSLQGTGHLFLHDVNSQYLVQAKKKLRHAKVKNFTILEPNSSALNSLRRKMDWVLVDVPSTGTGQFRRYPDRKWLYSDEHLEKSIQVQREIFAAALVFLKKRNAKIVYSTASILPEENLDQVKYFCETHGLYLSHEPVHSLPQSRGMDGFFCAILEKK